MPEGTEKSIEKKYTKNGVLNFTGMNISDLIRLDRENPEVFSSALSVENKDVVRKLIDRHVVDYGNAETDDAPIRIERYPSLVYPGDLDTNIPEYAILQPDLFTLNNLEKRVFGGAAKVAKHITSDLLRAVDGALEVMEGMAEHLKSIGVKEFSLELKAILGGSITFSVEEVVENLKKRRENKKIKEQGAADRQQQPLS